GTSAEEHHPAAPAHARERVTPSRNLPGTFDHQVGPEAIVEPPNFGSGIARCGVDHAIGAEPPRPFKPLRTAPRDRDLAYSGHAQRQHVEEAEGARANYQHALRRLGPRQRLRMDHAGERLPEPRL